MNEKKLSTSKRIRQFADDYENLLCSGPVLTLLQIAEDAKKQENNLLEALQGITSIVFGWINNLNTESDMEQAALMAEATIERAKTA